jgi:dTDP-4-dehydrorhamnose 3,5-epimerase
MSTNTNPAERALKLGSIDGVVITALTRHADDRGYFEELIRVTDSFFREGFGQLSHSKMYPGVIKAWHIHRTQVDWWYVGFGRLRVALHDLRAGSPTIGVTQELHMGEDLPPTVLKIPAGVAHGCRALGETPTHLFYVTSKTYDPEEEGRLAHDDPSINYDWISRPSIS